MGLYPSIGNQHFPRYLLLMTTYEEFLIISRSRTHENMDIITRSIVL